MVQEQEAQVHGATQTRERQEQVGVLWSPAGAFCVSLPAFLQAFQSRPSAFSPTRFQRRLGQLLKVEVGMKRLEVRKKQRACLEHVMR
jgi:hypothetical protein